MRTLPQFVPPNIVFGLLSLVAVSLSLPGYASSVTYQTETGETAMSFEVGDDADELSKALKSVTGLGESAAKAWGKLFGGD